MRTRLLHARLNVSDLAAARRFYRLLLGFEEAGAYPPENPVYVEYAMAEGAVFAIEQRRPVAGNVASGAVRLTFVVEDVRRLWVQWRGVVEVIEPYDELTEDALLHFAIRDADGNELGFVQE